MRFIKAFGLGLLYALLFPLFIVVFAIIAVFYGIGNFLYQSVLVIIHFFSGKPIFEPFEEDVKAYELRKAQYDAALASATAAANAPAPQPSATNVYIQQNFPTQQVQPNAVQQQASPSLGQNPFSAEAIEQPTSQFIENQQNQIESNPTFDQIPFDDGGDEL